VVEVIEDEVERSQCTKASQPRVPTKLLADVVELSALSTGLVIEIITVDGLRGWPYRFGLVEDRHINLFDSLPAEIMR
jgi:hypothetical protein